jgi:hypothetical protein
MKVYIGDKQLNDDTYKTIKDPGVLKYVADDSECTVIVMDGILRRLNLDSVLITIDDAIQKLRLGGKLKIIDIDFDLLMHVYKKIGNIGDLNRAVFLSSEVRSFLNYELILEIISKYPKVEVSAVNLKNIEFDIEVTRK